MLRSHLWDGTLLPNANTTRYEYLLGDSPDVVPILCITLTPWNKTEPAHCIDADRLSEVISVVLTAVHTQHAASAPCVFVAWWLMGHEEKGDPPHESPSGGEIE